jgi:hypothetical protein
MADELICDCGACTCGAPKSFLITISGVTGCGSQSCADCSGINGTFEATVDHKLSDECRWTYSVAETICCNNRVWQIGIARQPDCTYTMTATWYLFNNPYKLEGICSCTRDSYTLTLTDPDDREWLPPDPITPHTCCCYFPLTVTVEPVWPTQKEAICSGSCCPVPNTPAGDSGMPDNAVNPSCCCPVPPIAGLSNSSGCGSSQCSYQIDVRNGQLMIQAGMPDAGDSVATDLLFFNSIRRPQYSTAGWLRQYQRSVSSLGNGCDAMLYACNYSYCFSGLSTLSGYYRCPDPHSKNTLQKTATGWQEAEPVPGRKFDYDSSGILQTVQNPAGQVWTLNYVSGALSNIETPYGQRTTYSSSGLTSAIMDPHGRRTSYTYNSFGLASIT